MSWAPAWNKRAPTRWWPVPTWWYTRGFSVELPTHYRNLRHLYRPTQPHPSSDGSADVWILHWWDTGIHRNSPEIQTYKCLIHLRGNHKRSFSARQVFLDLLWTISRAICFFKSKRVITTEFSKFFWLHLNYCAVLLLQFTVSIEWHKCDVTPCCHYRLVITLTVHTNPSLALVYAQILPHLTQNLYFMLGECCW